MQNGLPIGQPQGGGGRGPPPSLSNPPKAPPVGEVAPTPYRVYMRGLPFKATEADVIKFFYPTMPVMVQFSGFGNNGLASGTANAFFSSHQDATIAMDKDNGFMGQRYIELVLCCGDNPGAVIINRGRGGSKRIRREGYQALNGNPQQHQPAPRFPHTHPYGNRGAQRGWRGPAPRSRGGYRGYPDRGGYSRGGYHSRGRGGGGGYRGGYGHGYGHGYDQSGYHGYGRGGYHSAGYDQSGYHGYDQSGYDQSYDQSGYDQSYEQGGYDQGYDQSGYDQSGYDQSGYDQGGYDQSGYDQSGNDGYQGGAEQVAEGQY
eukprot:sb/3466962/